MRNFDLCLRRFHELGAFTSYNHKALICQSLHFPEEYMLIYLALFFKRNPMNKFVKLKLMSAFVTFHVYHN